SQTTHVNLKVCGLCYRFRGKGAFKIQKLIAGRPAPHHFVLGGPIEKVSLALGTLKIFFLVNTDPELYGGILAGGDLVQNYIIRFRFLIDDKVAIVFWKSIF